MKHFGATLKKWIILTPVDAASLMNTRFTTSAAEQATDQHCTNTTLPLAQCFVCNTITVNAITLKLAVALPIYCANWMVLCCWAKWSCPHPHAQHKRTLEWRRIEHQYSAVLLAVRRPRLPFWKPTPLFEDLLWSARWIATSKNSLRLLYPLLPGARDARSKQFTYTRSAPIPSYASTTNQLSGTNVTQTHAVLTATASPRFYTTQNSNWVNRPLKCWQSNSASWNVGTHVNKYGWQDVIFKTTHP